MTGEHVENVTAYVRKIFIDLGDTASLALLDVRSAELYSVLS